MEVFIMLSESPANLSPDQIFARKFAAQELAKYCQEFSRWRKTKRASAALDKSSILQGPQGPLSMKKPDSPVPHSSA
jgi:hypothetical protein